MFAASDSEPLAALSAGSRRSLHHCDGESFSQAMFTNANEEVMGNALARSKIVSALGAMNADSDLGDTQGGTDPGDDFEHGLYKRAKRSCTATSGEAMVKAAS